VQKEKLYVKREKTSQFAKNVGWVVPSQTKERVEKNKDRGTETKDRSRLGEENLKKGDYETS